MNLEKKYKKFIKELDEVLSMAKEGLLKAEKMYEVIYRIEDELKEMSEGLDKRSRLAIEKNISTWRNIPKHGVFVKIEEAERKISPLKALLLDLLSKETGKTAVNLKSEIVIPRGKPYEGRLCFRNIIEQASHSIFIRDSYCRPMILDILLEYLLDNNDLEIKILMGENPRLPPFQASFEAFKQQYPQFNIEARYTASRDIDHPRYILIDNQLLFNPDHSIDQWGKKTVNIHQFTDPKEIQKAKTQLFTEWKNAIPI